MKRGELLGRTQTNNNQNYLPNSSESEGEIRGLQQDQSHISLNHLNLQLNSQTNNINWAIKKKYTLDIDLGKLYNILSIRSLNFYSVGSKETTIIYFIKHTKDSNY